MKVKQLNVNLATNPLRNRRFFYLCLCVLGIALICMSLISAKIFFENRIKAQNAKASIGETERLIVSEEGKEGLFSLRIEEAKKKYGKKIELINNIILSKSFSWIEFLSDLENSLPDSSYIVSLAPKLTEDLKMQLGLRVSSPNIAELLNFINNLRELKFHHIEIISEAKDENGELLSEISLTYEKHI